MKLKISVAFLTLSVCFGVSVLVKGLTTSPTPVTHSPDRWTQDGAQYPPKWTTPGR